MKFIRIVTFSLISVFSAALAFSQEAVDERTGKKAEEKAEKPEKAEKKPTRSIQELMTPEEFKAAGLDKLNEDELQHLDAWLQGYRQTTEKKASAQAEKKADEEIKKVTEQAKVTQKKVMVESVVSRIDGTFIGLTGHTVIKLEDGTVWKQANLIDHYQSVVTDHPMVSVAHGPFGYKMRVEGMPEFYVNPVRSKQ